MFHELRQPLNVSVLAYQNIHLDKGFNFQKEGVQLEAQASDEALRLMQTILNDGQSRLRGLLLIN